MSSFSAEQSSTMPAHLSITQHLLFHLFKLTRKKNHFSSQLKGLGAGGGKQTNFSSEALPFTLFFFILTEKTMISALTKLERWRPELHRHQLHCDTVSRKSHFTKMADGGGGAGRGKKEELTVSFVLSCIDSE